MTTTAMCPVSAKRPQAGPCRGGRPAQRETLPTNPTKLCGVVGLFALLLIVGCRDTTAPPSDPSRNPKGNDGIVGSDKKGKEDAAKDQSGCLYDENLTKYLPASTNRIDVMDFQGARSDQLLDVTLKGLLIQGKFGTWNHKEQGIGMLKQAGFAENSVVHLTLVRLQGFQEAAVFMRLGKAPDPKQYVQALTALPIQVDGKTCYEVRLLNATPLRHVHFLEPTLLVFSRDPKVIAQVAEAQKSPGVS